MINENEKEKDYKITAFYKTFCKTDLTVKALNDREALFKAKDKFEAINKDFNDGEYPKQLVFLEVKK